MLPPSFPLLHLDLLDAAHQGHFLNLQNALSRGADPLHADPSLDPDTYPPTHQLTALQCAAYHGHTDCVALLLPISDPLDQDGLNQTALHLAAKQGHADCVSVLLPASDPHLPDSYGQTPLTLAAQHGHADCVQQLLAPSANTQHSGTPFNVFQYAAREAARFGHTHCVQLIRAFLRAHHEQAALNYHTPSPPPLVKHKAHRV